MLAIGPKQLAPWGDRLWRVSISAQLVAANSGDYWLVTPTEPAEHPVNSDLVSLEMSFPDCVVESIVMLLAAHLGDANIEGYLVETANLQLIEGERCIAPYWDVSAPQTLRFLASRLSQMVRLGITILDETSLVDEAVIGALRSLGFDVDTYTLTSVSDS